MKLRVLFFLLLAMVPLMAADPPGFVIWPKGVPPADLKGKLDFGNHALSISHRDKKHVRTVFIQLKPIRDRFTRHRGREWPERLSKFDLEIQHPLHGGRTRVA